MQPLFPQINKLRIDCIPVSMAGHDFRMASELWANITTEWKPLKNETRYNNTLALAEWLRLLLKGLARCCPKRRTMGKEGTVAQQKANKMC